VTYAAWERNGFMAHLRECAADRDTDEHVEYEEWSPEDLVARFQRNAKLAKEVAA
jgi:hypothetical protein